MSFNEGVRSSSGRVRSSSGGAGRRTAGIGGGSLFAVIAVLLLSYFTGVDLTSLLSATPATSSSPAAPAVDLSSCTTGADANKRTECRMVTTADSLDIVWNTQMPMQNVPTTYSAPGFEVFTQSVSTRCGMATSSVGPFYCPLDQTVYLDLGFFQQMEKDFGATNTPLAQEYVVAHEWGHHIQNITGVFSARDSHEPGDQGEGVRSELQADCYAGVWMHWASTTIDPDSGVPFLVTPTEEEISQALATAAAIGDDRLQERYQGGSRADSWTHGSSEQRQRWLMKGLTEGSIASCNTFAVERV